MLKHSQSARLQTAPEAVDSVPHRRCTSSKVFMPLFLNVCDRARQSYDSCSLHANGKRSTSLILLVFISATAKCFGPLCASGECTTCVLLVFVSTGDMMLAETVATQTRAQVHNIALSSDHNTGKTLFF